MKEIYSVVKVISLAILVFLPAPTIKASPVSDKADFFSYEKFFLDQDVLSGISGDGKIDKDLRRFVHNFTEGLYAFSGRKFTKAEKFLSRARQLWPEYFITDFLLALVHENRNEYKLAARYYKSYLIKLGKFEKGEYRVSEGLIRALSARVIVPYDTAYFLIKARLMSNAERVDIDKAWPVITPPVSLFPVFLTLIIGGFFITVQYGLYPYLKNRGRIKNPPEGFWVCEHCYKTNPNLRKECERCRMKHE